MLLVLQGMDTSGKDGTVKHVIGAINPQGCRLVSFKAPTDEEKDIARANLKKLADQWTKHLARTGKPDKEQAAIQALATLCHAILNSAEFLYVD